MKYFYYENKYTAIHISTSEKNEYKILIGTFQILSWLAVKLLIILERRNKDKLRYKFLQTTRILDPV